MWKEWLQGHAARPPMSISGGLSPKLCVNREARNSFQKLYVVINLLTDMEVFVIKQIKSLIVEPEGSTSLSQFHPPPISTTYTYFRKI